MTVSSKVRSYTVFPIPQHPDDSIRGATVTVTVQAALLCHFCDLGVGVVVDVVIVLALSVLQFNCSCRHCSPCHALINAIKLLVLAVSCP